MTEEQNTEPLADVLVVDEIEETAISTEGDNASITDNVSVADDELQTLPESEAIITQEILVTTTDPIKFAELLLEWGKKGARLKEKSYVYLRRMPLQAHLVIEVGEENIISPDANSKVSPVGDYLKPEQFEELSWAEVVQLGKKLGLKYGKRDEMTAEYFAYVEKEYGIVFK